MRVLFLVYEIFGYGGNFFRAFSYARALASMDCEVTFICSRKDKGNKIRNSIVQNVRIIEFPDVSPFKIRHAGISPVDFFWRNNFLKKNTFDVIQTFSHRPVVSFPPLFNRRSANSIIISDWADLWGKGGVADTRNFLSRYTLGEMDEFWEKRYYKMTTGTSVITSHLKNKLVKNNVPQASILLLSVGSNHDQIIPGDKLMKRKELGLPADKKILVYTSLNEYDAEYLTESFIKMASLEKDIYLLIAGKFSPGNQRKLCKRNLENNYKYFGVISHDLLHDIIIAGDVMIVPYRDNELNRARFPNRFGDYIAAGKPIITNPTGDFGEIIHSEKIGITAPEHIDLFAGSVIDLVNSPQLLDDMGKRARSLSETRFSIFNLAQELKNFYGKFLK